jgi:hypothetical protein
MASPNLQMVWPPITRPVQPSLVLCTRSPTPATILVTACHATPVTCTPRDKQMRFSKWNNDKRKTTKMSWILIQTLPSQWLMTIKPRNWPLGFSHVISHVETHNCMNCDIFRHTYDELECHRFSDDCSVRHKIYGNFLLIVIVVHLRQTFCDNDLFLTMASPKYKRWQKKL